MPTKINTILLPTDFSMKSKNAMKLAVKMAQRHHAKLILTHVVHTYYLIDRGGKQVIGSQTVQENLDQAQLKLKDLKDRLELKYNVPIETRISNQDIVRSINDLILTEDVFWWLYRLQGDKI